MTKGLFKLFSSKHGSMYRYWFHTSLVKLSKIELYHVISSMPSILFCKINNGSHTYCLFVIGLFRIHPHQLFFAPIIKFDYIWYSNIARFCKFYDPITLGVSAWSTTLTSRSSSEKVLFSSSHSFVSMWLNKNIDVSLTLHQLTPYIHNTRL